MITDRNSRLRKVSVILSKRYNNNNKQQQGLVPFENGLSDTLSSSTSLVGVFYGIFQYDPLVVVL